MGHHTANCLTLTTPEQVREILEDGRIVSIDTEEITDEPLLHIRYVDDEEDLYIDEARATETRPGTETGPRRHARRAPPRCPPP